MVIGIGGISNAGKSRLAQMIKNHYSYKKIAVLCQDDYAFPSEKIPVIRDHTDWENPASIDFKQYEKTIINEIKKNDIVITEGIFAFYIESTNKLMDKKLFLTLDRRFFFMRKNTDLRWGKEPDWYIEHIWNNHIMYCKKHIPADTLQIKAGKTIDMDKVFSFLESDS